MVIGAALEIWRGLALALERQHPDAEPGGGEVRHAVEQVASVAGPIIGVLALRGFENQALAARAVGRLLVQVVLPAAKGTVDDLFSVGRPDRITVIVGVEGEA